MLYQISAEHYSPTESIKTSSGGQQIKRQCSQQPGSQVNHTIQCWPHRGSSGKFAVLKDSGNYLDPLRQFLVNVRDRNTTGSCRSWHCKFTWGAQEKVISITSLFLSCIQLQFIVASYYRISDFLKQQILWIFFFFLSWQFAVGFPIVSYG